MKQKYEIKKSCLRLLGMTVLSFFFVACGNDDIDNNYSRNNYEVNLTASSENVILDESKPNEVALTLEWTPSHDYGNDYIVTYNYQMELVGSKADAIKEYEDGGMFIRNYTNKELQDLLVDKFDQLTSTKGVMKFTVTASTEGPRLIVPDIATVSVTVKTYGAKQFMADKVFLAVEGQEDIELVPTASNPQQYVYSGELPAGRIYFPVLYGDEENAICPVTPDMAITTESMEATVVDRTETNAWILPETGNYRITVDFDAKTVKIIALGEIIEIDKLYLAGSAVTGEDIEVARTLENDNLYAFKGELKAGSLYLPILFADTKQYAIAPKTEGAQDVEYAQDMPLKQIALEKAMRGAYWNIPEDGIYRIVVDAENQNIRIYSQDTDIQSKVVGPWNAQNAFGNTQDETLKTYSGPIEKLWMYGTFNGRQTHDDGVPAGFQGKYTLNQSLANPNVFVYKGANLPRQTAGDYWEKNQITGSVMFFVGVKTDDGVERTNNNAYAFGSTADADRDEKRCGYITATAGTSLELVEGQDDNRYAYFIIPENTNYVMVDIENLKVIFDHK